MWYKLGNENPDIVASRFYLAVSKDLKTQIKLWKIIINSWIQAFYNFFYSVRIILINAKSSR